MNDAAHGVEGAGLGLRRALLGPLADLAQGRVDFMEVAPENWIGVGGALGRKLRAYTERYPFFSHGLSLSLGSPAPLDTALLDDIKQFLNQHGIRKYSEHLSYCSDAGHLYDLMPIPFTEEAVEHVAGRIRRVQDTLGERIAVENVSYYAAPDQQMSEIDFTNAVLREADCELLLDVNNIYVNSVNHGYDPLAFLNALPAERVSYIHVAGHDQYADDLLVDTHGAEVVPPVWGLLQQAYRHCGALPTLLERDSNLPPLPKLLAEVDTIRSFQRSHVHGHGAGTGHG